MQDKKLLNASTDRSSGDRHAMLKIAFFGHDAADAAVRRRAKSFSIDGLSVFGFTMRRNDDQQRSFPNVDLGQTYDGNFLQRIKQIFRGARIAAQPENGLAETDVIYARNLDMLACAFLAKRHAKLKTKVIYECLDVHRMLVRRDPIGMILRALERALLKRSAGLVVSSPAFLTHYFERYHNGLYTSALVENRLTERPSNQRTPPVAKPGAPDQKLRIGWVGILRCQRSMDLLCSLADKFGDQIEIKLHGKPARTEIPVFEPKIECRPNMTYHGPYSAPEDLSALYGGLDLVWAGDFMEAGYNSVWLLPNRIYEGGYFATPSICVAETETANWVMRKQAGCPVGEPLETELPALIERLIADRTPLDTAQKHLLAEPEDTFIQPKGLLAKIVFEFLDSGGSA